VNGHYWSIEGVDLLRLDASTHRYSPHSHEGYALGVVESGAHAFTARGQRWTAVPGRVIVVNPEDAHDGGPATRRDEYSYRMMYVDRDVIVAALGSMPLFRECVVHDEALAARVSTLHRAFEGAATCDSLLAETLVELAQRHSAVRPARETHRPSPSDVSVVLDYLHEHFAENCSLAKLAALAGVDRFHLLRAFHRAVGLPPHRYQTQLRLRHAKHLLLSGESPSQAAVAAGFADQSHLIRKFKAAYGITPGAITFNRRPKTERYASRDEHGGVAARHSRAP
jgi:AraC-like DNA-binding protein